MKHHRFEYGTGWVDGLKKSTSTEKKGYTELKIFSYNHGRYGGGDSNSSGVAGDWQTGDYISMSPA